MSHLRVTRILTLSVLCWALAGAGPALARAKTKAPPGKAAAAQAGVVNINGASAEQLELLPGIGPSKAERIVAYRAKRKFGAPHELVRVRGIGRKTLRTLRPYLTVRGPTTLTKKVRRSKQQ